MLAALPPQSANFTFSPTTPAISQDVLFTATAAAGVPGGSLPLIVIVLQSVGVPGESIGIILGIDRVLDMCRTVLNVLGDLVIATCVSRMEARASRR